MEGSSIAVDRTQSDRKLGRFSQKVVSFPGDLAFGGLFPKRWSSMPTYGPGQLNWTVFSNVGSNITIC